MREILFRGKTSGTNSKWVYGSLIKTPAYCCILEREEDVHPMDYPYLDDDLGTIDGKATPVDPKSVGEFVLNYDRKGTKLFEGDIFKIYNRRGEARDYLGIVISDSCFMDMERCGRQMPQDTISVEVIGNVYDNQDLLSEHAIKWLYNCYFSDFEMEKFGKWS